LASRLAAAASDGTVRLAWTAVAGADTYQIELYTATLDKVAVLRASGPAVTVAAEVAVRTGSDVVALCRLRAAGPGGDLATSPLRAIRLR